MGKGKTSGFSILGDFVPFHLQERRKLCSGRDIKWKKHGREFVSWQEKVGREDAGFKSSFTLQVVEIHLGHEQSVF